MTIGRSIDIERQSRSTREHFSRILSNDVRETKVDSQDIPTFLPLVACTQRFSSSFLIHYLFHRHLLLVHESRKYFGMKT